VNNIKLSDYLYDLDEEKIAKYGINKRDQSKLLKYENGEIEDHVFSEIADLLPANSILFFNDTRVVQARLFFTTITGAKIEIFLLNPADSSRLFEQAVGQQNQVTFECIVGNLKKWKNHEILHENITLNKSEISLSVELISRAKNHVAFSWNNTKIDFTEIIEAIGHTPIPPYLKRPDEAKDKHRYQTVYSRIPGAVAAPTAGLHFTKKVLSEIGKMGIKKEYLTLHVSAGTFKPIKDENIYAHPMHKEKVFLTKSNLLAALNSQLIIAVGTTALRTLESAYWFGVKLLDDENSNFNIEKLLPYEYLGEPPTKKAAFTAILNYMETHKLEQICGQTEIFILPGYKFSVCNGLITNFHQPGSTLILLIAAFVGKNWRKIYQHAISNDYKFLSYGDSSLLLRS